MSAQLETLARDFDAGRRRLFGIAYRMTGSRTESEDLVQEAWLRWQDVDHDAVTNPGSYLATVVTRLAINHVTSARARRETYVGPWLPDPIDTGADPTVGAETCEAVSVAVLLLMERLGPAERAAYVLRKAFDYPYAEIAAILEVSEVGARQLVSRADKHLEQGRPRPVPDGEQRRLLEAFLAAARDGDVARLEQLFADDVVSLADSGGLTRAASRVPILGREHVAAVVGAFSRSYWDGVTVDPVEVNGEPALELRRDGDRFGLLTVTASPDGITQVLWLVNPEKIAAF